MNIEIICNIKGTGKTTYALNKFTPNLHYLYQSENPVKFIEPTDEISNKYVIIDSIENIPPTTFAEIVNKLNKHNPISVIFIFDIIKEKLIECPNFNMLADCGILQRNYQFHNFYADRKTIYEFLQRYYPEISSEQYEEILRLTNYNFNEIDRLMLLNTIFNEEPDSIKPETLAIYIDKYIQKEFKNIPDAYLLLKKSAIIGENFSSEPLESTTCFNIKYASSYLKQMEEMHGLVKSSFSMNKSFFEFISHDLYLGIYNSISMPNKIEWVEKLVCYCKEECSKSNDIMVRCILLNKLKNLYKLLPEKSFALKNVYFRLLYLYQIIDNSHEALKVADEAVKHLDSTLTSTEFSFLINFRIETLMQNGEYKQAVVILKDIINSSDRYAGSLMFIKYYYSLCLYCSGDVDLSYTIITEIVADIKSTSGSSQHEQEIFCLVYSLFATLQNHLGLEDGGFRYYGLALNNAYKRLENKKFYYSILKKSDMFQEYPQNISDLQKCLDFYEKDRNWAFAGEVSLNLATEMLFQNSYDTEMIKIYYDKSLFYFKDLYNEKLAYAKNNLGIYFVIIEKDIEKALQSFKEALLAGLSDFSYMTIYLNICMCYILLNQYEESVFLDAKVRFDFAIKKLEKRQNETIYEDIYKKILELLLREHQGYNVQKEVVEIQHSLSEDSFFMPLINDIACRNTASNSSVAPYRENAPYYLCMNELRAFFAEFRFWE